MAILKNKNDLKSMALCFILKRKKKKPSKRRDLTQNNEKKETVNIRAYTN